MAISKTVTTHNFLLDTNFLMIPFQFKVDIFSELTKFGKPQCFTLNLVVNELEKLAVGSGKNASHAKLALFAARRERVKVLFSKSRGADAGLLKIAKEKHMALCTQDRALGQRARKRGIPVITLRQKRYLVKKC